MLRPGHDNSIKDQVYIHFDLGGTPDNMPPELLYVGNPIYLRKLYTEWRKYTGHRSTDHVAEKKAQIVSILPDKDNLRIFEAYPGTPGEEGAMTGVYRPYARRGRLVGFPYDKSSGASRRETDPFASMYLMLHLAAKHGHKEKVDLVDIDPYGYTGGKMLRSGILSLLRKTGYLFLTVATPYCHRGRTATRATNHICFGNASPTVDDVVKAVRESGWVHSFKSELLSHVKLDTINRFAFQLDRFKPTSYFAEHAAEVGITPPRKGTVHV